MEALSATQDDSSGANPSSIKSDDSSPRQESGRGSPPPKCAICLGTCRNKSFTDSCLHQFCFKCLLTWSKVKAECPLCKQNFRSIIHNVRSNHQYEEYMVEQRHTEELTEHIDIDNHTTATRRFRYRTTLTFPRRETLAIQQLLLHYPLMADVFPPPAPRAPVARRRRSPAAFRRTVYRHNLWARPLPDFTGRFRDCTPEFYRYNDTQMHRLVPWLNRELHYLLNENILHIPHVISRILELLPQYHISSPEFRETMLRYFGERTEHFLHELYCFASTPYDLTGYDRNVQYTTDTRISTMVNEVISSSDSDSVDSDIVLVSHSEPAEPPPGPSRAPPPVYPQNYIPQPTVNNVIPIETISHSDTDDDDEVMVVGYIKPPQDRTPEVVDLLGSDSDVIVQDNAQAETSHTEETQTVPRVKLILKRHRNGTNANSDSDGSYKPSSRRKKRQNSNGTATTSDTCRTTPSPRLNSDWSVELSSLVTSGYNFDAPSTSRGSESSSVFNSPYSDSETPYSSSSSDEKRKKKKKTKRKKESTTQKDKRKRKNKKRSRERRSSKDSDRDKRSKKSNSGKGVKSSKKSSAVPVIETSTTPPLSALDQPSTSGTNHRVEDERQVQRNIRESKRLRSVVNVINSRRASGESSQSGVNSYTLEERNRVSPLEQRESNSDTDPDDNLPLNLSLHKTYKAL